MKVLELKDFGNLYRNAYYVGSRYTCNPPPTDTDLDILVQTDDLDAFFQKCDELGFEMAGYLIENETHDTRDSVLKFKSLKKDNINLIVSYTDDFTNKFLAATSVAKKLNLMDKIDRVLLFRAVLYGEAVPKEMISDIEVFGDLNET